MIQSQLPLKLTACVALIALALLCLQKGYVDATVGTGILVGLFNFGLGVLTHTKVPEEDWKAQKTGDQSSKTP